MLPNIDPAPVPINRLTLPRSWHRQILERHLDPDSPFLAVGRLGESRNPEGGREWLVRAIDQDLSSLANPTGEGGPLVVFTREDGKRRVPWVESMLDPLPASVKVELVHGIGEFEGRIWGFQRDGKHIVPLDELSLPGSAMLRLPLRPGSELRKENGSTAFETESLSRTTGAYGSGGTEMLRRLQSHFFVILGCSRTGLLVAEWAARLRIPLILLDTKPVKLSHLGEISIALGEEDVGKTKVEAFARRLGEWSIARAPIQPIVARADSAEGILAAKKSSLLVEACDSETGRVSASIYGNALHRPVLSLATGVSFDGDGARTLGADIRLIVPGDSRCLLCLGGMLDHRRTLREMWTQSRVETDDDAWREERAGSLRSLSQVAAGLGIRLIEDLFNGRIDQSRWLRCLWDETGRLEVREPSPGPGGCELCGDSGKGDLAYPTV